MPDNLIDFNEEDLTAEYAYRQDWRELANFSFQPTTDFNPKEIREAIVQDITAITMFENQTNIKLNFTVAELLLFVHDPEERSRIYRELQHEEIRRFFSHKEIPIISTQLRICNNRGMLQAAMDYCGVWYNSFNMPPDALIINREALKKAVQQTGSIENLAVSLSMDLNATTKGPSKPQ